MILAIVGPTATGKSDLGLEVASRICRDPKWLRHFPGGAEIISADAFQLYRGMDIGTAKTPMAQRRGIPHHQLDVLWPNEEASVAAYQREARRDVEAIQSRGAVPVVVGGSGLYVRALLDELEFPPTDPEVRAKWQAEADMQGPEKLHEILEQLDPESAAAIEPLNTRRLVRALEVIEITDRPFSATLPKGTYWQSDTRVFYLTRELDELDHRINVRSAQMFTTGLLEETEKLLADTSHPLGITAQKATGYREAIATLQGTLTIPEAIEATSLATRQLSRRQIKWFRRDKRSTQIVWRDGETLEEKIGMILTQAGGQILGD